MAAGGGVAGGGASAGGYSGGAAGQASTASNGGTAAVTSTGGAVAGQTGVPSGGGAAAGQAHAAVNGVATGAPAGAAPGSGAAAAAAQEDAMLRQLASLWGQQVPEGDFCAGAARLNLRCLRGRSGLEELLRLDRPAMLTLTDAKGPHPVLLTGFDGRNVTLHSAGGTETMAADALAVRFDGAYTTLWRAPRAWRDEVGEGDRGPDVDWLARRLADINGTRKPRDNRPLDGASVRLLKAFQQAQGLKADGVAGPKTMIRLQQLAGVQEPRLGRTAPAVAGK
jgi:general secretion pathway protein A